MPVCFYVCSHFWILFWDPCISKCCITAKEYNALSSVVLQNLVIIKAGPWGQLMCQFFFSRIIFAKWNCLIIYKQVWWQNRSIFCQNVLPLLRTASSSAKYVARLCEDRLHSQAEKWYSLSICSAVLLFQFYFTSQNLKSLWLIHCPWRKYFIQELITFSCSHGWKFRWNSPIFWKFKVADMDIRGKKIWEFWEKFR